MLTYLLIQILSKYFPDLFSRFKLTRQINKIIQSIAFLLLFIFLPFQGLTQQYTYTVTKGEKQIGALSVRCLKEGDKVTYSIFSEAKTGFILTIKVNVLIEETFKMEKLEQSTFIRKINGIEMVKNVVVKNMDGYLLNYNGDENRNIVKEIIYTMGSMYFIEPVNRSSVFSENYQQFIPIIALENNRYLIKFPDGNKSYYTYINGKCTDVEVHTNLTTLHFILSRISVLNEIYTQTKY